MPHLKGTLPAFVLLSLAIAAPLRADSQTPQVDDAALVGCWDFGRSDGQAVEDQSHRGNDGVIEFAELRQESGCQALELDGIDAHVLIGQKTPFGLSRKITTTLWVKPFRLSNNTVLFGIPNPTESWTTPIFGMYVSDRRMVYGMWFQTGGKVLVESPGELPLHHWSFLAATYDGTTVRLYVNGEPVAEAPASGSIARDERALLVGKGAGTNKPSLRGRIGELRVYSRPLEAAEIRTLYEQGKGSYGPPPAGQPAFKDGTVIVQTHGNSPEGERPWRQQPTRLLELLDGYQPSGVAVKLDRFGGRADRPREKASGYFHTKKIDGRHWLVDPDGCRFFHVAMNAAREPRHVEANFGSADQWAEALTAQLRDNGFNGLGNWSSPRLAQVRNPLVWVLRKDFMFAFARKKGLTEPAAGTQGFTNRCMPVFHPEFEDFCDQYGRDLADTARDPYLLGIMTDNELQCPIDLLDRYLALDPGHPDLKPNHDAAAAWLESRRGSADTAGITQRDRCQFIAFAFERYYQIVTRAVRRYDPNHLYLGSRLNYRQGQFENPWFWKMLARYHDVISVNYYNMWGPDLHQLAEWEEWAGRPILFTEWYAKAADVPGLANRLGAGWLVRTQEDRGRFYQHFALGALESGNVVGWHWFKYLDDPAESKALDSAGGANKGMFDLEGRPYQPLLDRARAINREAYPLVEFFQSRRTQR